VKISGRVDLRQLTGAEAIKPGATSSGPQASTRARHPTGSAGLNLLGKMAGHAAEILSARLRGLTDAVVQEAVGYVKSAVTSLASSVAAATFGAHAAPAAGSGASGGAAKPADPALSPVRAKLPPIERPAASMPAPLALESARQAPPRTIAQDPGFGAAFDKWVADNKFESPEAPAAAPAPGPVAAAAAKAAEPAPQAVLSRLEQDPGFSAAFDKWVKDNGFDKAGTSTPASPLPGSPAAQPTPAAQPAPAGDAASALLNRKQPLTESQSELMGLMADLAGLRAQVKPPVADGKDSPPKAATPEAATTAATTATAPQGKVYTNPQEFARALDKWERDNHFDYDRPMPHDHVPEPRPQLLRPGSTSSGTAAGGTASSAAEAAAQQAAERAAHQAAINNNYR
jgi:hypothetical protein